MSDTAKQLWKDYCGPAYEEHAVESFDEAYQGEYESLEDFAYSMAPEFCEDWAYMIEKLGEAGFLLPDVDLIAWQQDYVDLDGHIFRMV